MNSKKRALAYRNVFWLVILTSSFSNVLAQKISDPQTKFSSQIELQCANKSPYDQSKAIKKWKGRIQDDKGEPVSFATISSTDSAQTVMADVNGYFEISFEGKDRKNVIVTAIGFEPVSHVISNGRLDTILMHVKSELMDPVRVIAYGYQSRKVICICDFATITKYNLTISPNGHQSTDNNLEKLSVYPNPVQRNSSLKVKVVMLEPGEYALTIRNMIGQIIQAGQFIFDVKADTKELPLKDFPPGSYLLQVVNKKTRLAYSKKVIVQ